MSNTTYKTSFEMSEEDFQDLERLAASKGLTKGDVLRQAFAHFKFFQEMQRKGGTILIEDKNRNLNKVIFP
ncbi:hypothetical protein INH39_04330 [Massilia violaceinigra]|uniref:Ribbon-helix-helix protein CopG domain-containing protein n=1 Tax=Massilia violaceinigra TaxID=2045208 RepID=A0ABY4AEH8_9BURK|nr:hypothetical protein [Massilia violaceinigra]UOD30968.1 hypothetical protein INH39_04330 [Massilia violaceinigra]